MVLLCFFLLLVVVRRHSFVSLIYNEGTDCLLAIFPSLPLTPQPRIDKGCCFGLVCWFAYVSIIQSDPPFVRSLVNTCTHRHLAFQQATSAPFPRQGKKEGGGRSHTHTHTRTPFNSSVSASMRNSLSLPHSLLYESNYCAKMDMHSLLTYKSTLSLALTL